MADLILDLNCDLGEGEHPSRTRALMRQLGSANVACGGHAGDSRSMAHCVRLAREFKVRLGAHPGPPNRNDFGRCAIRPTADELTRWVFEQASALQTIARQEGLTLHHIKLHGALYHAAEADAELAEAYARTVRIHFPGTRIYCRSGGRVACTAQAMGIEVREELFADRAYLADGQLVPRDRPGAVLTEMSQVLARLRHWLETGRIESLDGAHIELRAQTLCVHGDTPGAPALAKALRRTLTGHCRT